MTTVQPTLQKVSPPSLDGVLDAHKRDIQKSINCARIGVIQSFDAANQTATVMVAQQQVTSMSPQGVRTLKEFPELYVVPVVFPSGGGFTLTFPVNQGDECLVVFNDRELDNWLSTGAGSTPTTGRVHDLSDGIAFVGLRSNPRALGNVSTTAAQLRSDDGTTFVELNPNGVKVHAGTVYEWDVHGYGQRVTWTGGVNYTIENFTIGANVTTVNSPIAPPGPP